MNLPALRRGVMHENLKVERLAKYQYHLIPYD